MFVSEVFYLQDTGGGDKDGKQMKGKQQATHIVQKK